MLRVPAAIFNAVLLTVVDRFHHSQVQDVQGKIRVFHATEVIEASTNAALEDARSWLIGQQPQAGPGPATDPDDAQGNH